MTTCEPRRLRCNNGHRTRYVQHNYCIVGRRTATGTADEQRPKTLRVPRGEGALCADYPADIVRSASPIPRLYNDHCITTGRPRSYYYCSVLRSTVHCPTDRLSRLGIHCCCIIILLYITIFLLFKFRSRSATVRIIIVHSRIL